MRGRKLQRTSRRGVRDIVDVYVHRIRPRAEEVRDWFARMPSLRTATQIAARSETPEGKRHSHQRRITKVALAKAERRLLTAASRLRSCSDFDELHALVNRLVRPIRGIGELYVYDVATRLGHFLGLEPRRVYLHAGTRVGARALGIGRTRTIEMSQLPAPFRRLRPAEVEDALCIFKDALLGLGSRLRSQCLPPPRRPNIC